MRLGIQDRETDTLMTIYLLVKSGISMGEMGIPKDDVPKVIDGIKNIIMAKNEIEIKEDKIRNLKMRF